MFTMSEFSTVIESIIAGKDLSINEAESLMDQVMSGEWDEARIGSFLTALRAKGETADEIAGFARSMRSHAKAFEVDPEYRPVVDTCGTGGDSVESINISTLSAIVAAGAGVRVAKHGNRSVSSECGSADLLEAFGVELELGPDEVKESIERHGIGFMYAPAFHKAMKHAIDPRKSLGIRTVFNLLGPLTNPADADRQLLGVFSEDWVRPVADALRSLGVERAMVVHGAVGMDEISLSSETVCVEVEDGTLIDRSLTHDDFGLPSIDVEQIAGGGLETNKAISDDLLAGEAAEPVEAIIRANAGAVIYLAGEAESLEEGAERARESIHSGDAREKIDRLSEFTQSVAKPA
jgi:anthranilate phosphoribosyltransferase